jgi:hypothetical protein
VPLYLAITPLKFDHIICRKKGENVGVDEGLGPILFRLALSVAQFQGGPPGSFWVGTDLFRASKAKRG